MAKVIIADSLGRSTVHEQLYKDGITESAAHKLACRWNDRRMRGSMQVAKVVDDDYILK